MFNILFRRLGVWFDSTLRQFSEGIVVLLSSDKVASASLTA